MLIKRQSCNRLTALSYHTSLSKEKIKAQNKYYLFNLENSNSFEFRKDQFLLVKKKYITINAVKKLTKILLGPFLVSKLHKVAVTLIP